MDSVDNKMNIKTSRTDVNPSSQQATRANRSSAEVASAPAHSSLAENDKVTFTNAAAELLKLEETLALIPEVDDNRVAVIQASIADGSYQVEPEKIVDNLLNLERDLL